MTAVAELLRPAEAAIVAQADLRTIHRTIDEHVLPEGLYEAGEARRIWAGACGLIAFYAGEAAWLTAEARGDVVREAGRRLLPLGAAELPSLLDAEWLVTRRGALTIDLRPHMRAAHEAARRLQAARDLVESDPGLLGGTPVIRGTRIPVQDVAASVAAGWPEDRIRAAYPALDAERIALAGLYGRANPPRGRPRTARMPEGARIVTDRRAPRRAG